MSTYRGLVWLSDLLFLLNVPMQQQLIISFLLLLLSFNNLMCKLSFRFERSLTKVISEQATQSAIVWVSWKVTNQEQSQAHFIKETLFKGCESQGFELFHVFISFTFFHSSSLKFYDAFDCFQEIFLLQCDNIYHYNK